jgi:hypothetical protein
VLLPLAGGTTVPHPAVRQPQGGRLRSAPERAYLGLLDDEISSIQWSLTGPVVGGGRFPRHRRAVVVSVACRTLDFGNINWRIG